MRIIKANQYRNYLLKKQNRFLKFLEKARTIKKASGGIFMLIIFTLSAKINLQSLFANTLANPEIAHTKNGLAIKRIWKSWKHSLPGT